MTEDNTAIDFHFFTALAGDAGVCIESEEGSHVYRFQPVPTPPLSVGQAHTEFPSPLPKSMTPATLAKRWSCSERHVRNMINTGELRCFRLGGRLIRILQEDIAAREASGSVPIDEPIVAKPPSAEKPPRKKPAERLATRSWKYSSPD